MEPEPVQTGGGKRGDNAVVIAAFSGFTPGAAIFHASGGVCFPMRKTPVPFRFQLILDQPRAMNDIAPLLAAGVDCLHIRIRNMTDRELLDHTRDVVALSREYGATVLVNGRLDVALAAGADGVQLPSHGIPVKTARVLAPGSMIGASVHSEAEAEMARDAGSDVVTFGHIFASASHEGDAPRGVAALRRVVQQVGPGIPVVAIGGIETDRIPEVFSAGAAAVAVIGAVWLAMDRVSATRQMRERIDTCISS